MNMKLNRKRTLLTALLVWGIVPAMAEADILYVDNLKGSDAFDGRSPNPQSETTGPVQSIRRALQLARSGDTIIVNNTGRPYYESVTLSGGTHSGATNRPFTLIGNGAVLDGSRPVPPEAWRSTGKNIWRFTPWRKGFFQLLLHNKPVPEYRPASRIDSPEEIPVGQWAVIKGSIYYRAAEKENPYERPFRYAAESVGITLYDVHSVQILDFTLRHYRLDGINAHDRCRFITLEKITSLENGRSGITVGGSSAVLLRNVAVSGNRMHSILLQELGAVKLEESRLDRPPTLPE